jgi:WD40 repeat protein
MSTHRPVVFLAFADAQSDLPSLRDEGWSLKDQFDELKRRGVIADVVPEERASLERIETAFLRYRDRIALFHFGGHADKGRLFLESALEARPAYAEGLATLLGQQRGLKLVFLNGCSTRPQVKRLLDAGVPAVIATARPIVDAVAAEFAKAFYQALTMDDGGEGRQIAGGCSLAMAFAHAEGSIKRARGGTARNLFAGTPTHEDVADDEGFPWRLQFRPGSEDVARWNLLQHDPLFNLPLPTDIGWPDEPYRNLANFRRDDARIFFGRGRAIRELYDLLTLPSESAESRLIFYYGQTGVGKTSVLAAGFLPRLEGRFATRYCRRSAQDGLLGTLRAELAAGREPFDLGTAWLEMEDRTGLPLVIVLDQAEEAFTRPRADSRPGDEVRALFEAVREAFAAAHPKRPLGRLILGFRKEWLADFDELRKASQLDVKRMMLDPLDRPGVIDAIEGPAGHFGLVINPDRSNVEPGKTTLAKFMADGLFDTLANPQTEQESPIAPTLQMLLTRMWEEANDPGRLRGRPTFDRALYHHLKAKGFELDEVIQEQFTRIAAVEGQREAVEAGLLLDLLEFFTTHEGTADTHTRRQVGRRYRHLPEGRLDALLEACKGSYFLADVGVGEDGTTAYRLAHDTLAPLLRERFRVSPDVAQRARRVLEGRSADWKGQSAGSMLDSVDLAAVEEGLPWMRDPAGYETALLEASRRAEERRRAEEAERQRQLREALESKQQETALRLKEQAVALGRLRRRAAVLAAVSAATILFAILAGYQRNQAIEQGNIARKNEGLARHNEWLARHEAYASDLSLAEHSHRENQPASVRDLLGRQRPRAGEEDLREFAWSQLSGLYDAPNVTVRLDSDPKRMAFSPDGRTVATCSEGNKAVQLWNAGTGRRIAEVQHEEEITGVAFVGKGQALATASRDRTVRLWNADTGERLKTFEYEHAVLNLFVSPDGGTLATRTRESGPVITPPIWSLRDLATGAERNLKDVNLYAEYSCLSFSPKGDILALGDEHGKVLLVDVKTGGTRSTLRSQRGWHLKDIAFSPDQTWLAMALDVGPNNQVRLLDMAGGQERAVLEAPDTANNQILSVQFSPDGGKVALVSGDPAIASPIQKSVVLVWDAATGRELLRLDQAKTGFVSQMRFSSDGTFMATAGEDYTIRLWDAADGRLRNVLGRHDGRITHLIFPRVGASIATASHDRSIRIWDTDIRPDYLRVPGDPADYSAAAFSPDGRMLATGSREGRLAMWDAITRDRIRELRGHATRIERVAFTPDGRTLVSASADGVVKLWNVATADQVSAFAGPGGESETLLLGGKLLIHFARPWGFDRSTGRLGVWNRESREPVAALNREFNVCACSADGSFIATIGGLKDDSRKRELTVWDIHKMTPRIIETWDGPQTQVTRAALSPDGKVLAVGGPRLPGSRDGANESGAVLYHTDNSSQLRTLRFPVDFTSDGQLRALEFSPDGRTLAIVSPESSLPQGSTIGVKLWDVSTGELRKTLFDEHDAASGVFAGVSGVRYLRFSPNGRYVSLVVGESNRLAPNDIIIWDLMNEGRRTIHCGGRIEDLIFSRKGDLVAGTTVSGRENGNPVIIWETGSGQELGMVGDLQPWIDNMTVTRDGRVLAGVHEYSPTQPVARQMWDLTAGKLVALTREGGLSQVGLSSISMDGGRLVTELSENRVLLWDVTGNRSIATLPGRIPLALDRVPIAAFSPDGAVLATIDGDKIIVFDGHTGQRRGAVTGRPPIAFSSRRDTLAMIDDGGRVSLRDYRTGRELTRLGEKPLAPRAIVLSHDGETVLTLWDAEARLWDAATGDERTALKGYDVSFSRPYLIIQTPFGAFSPDGRTLATAGKSGRVDLWDPVSGRRLLTLDGPEREIVGLAFSADGRTLFVAHDNEVRVWRTSRDTSVSGRR